MALDAPLNKARSKEIKRIKEMDLTFSDVCQCQRCSNTNAWTYVSPEDRNGIHWQITEHIKAMQNNKEKEPTFEEILVIIARIAYFTDFGTLEHIYDEWKQHVKTWYPLKMDPMLWNKTF